MVATALFVSDGWRRVPADESTAGARTLGMLTTAFAFLQLVAGAVTRHTGAVLIVHLAGAGLVLLTVSLFASRLMMTPLKKGANLLMILLGSQMILGMSTWAFKAAGFQRSHESPLLQILTSSTHVAIGAALLATTLGVTLMCHRGTAPTPVRLEASPA